MWKLTIEDDEGKQTSLPLAHEEYGLGRAEANAIRLTDRNVSRSHALLKQNGQGWFLKDLQSYNGTFVNGVRVIGEQLIHSGDVVQLGDYRVELLDETTALGITGDPTQITAPPQVAAPVHQRPNRLVVVVGPTPGAEFPLDRDHFTIGRSEEATISVNHSSVSRVHAEVIAIGNGRFEIVDKASANGIRINGVELKRGILEAGDALELGDVRLRFVGAGKIFRAGADQSQQLSAAVAAGALDSVATSVRAPALVKPSGPSIGKLVGIGAAVGILAIAIFVLTRNSGTSQARPAASSVAAVSPSDEGSKILTAAKEKFAAKEFDAAHKKLEEVAEDSPIRQDPTFKDIEAGWADSVFKTVEASSDNAEKKKLLQQVSRTTSVDPERRKKAADMIRAISEAEPAPVEPKPAAPAHTPKSPQTGAAQPEPYERPPAATAAKPEKPERPEKPEKPERPAAPTRGTDPAPVPPVRAQGPPDEEQMRKNLEPKVWSGRASVEEIKMLKAICSHLGNRDCRDRAAAMLKKKQEASP